MSVEDTTTWQPGDELLYRFRRMDGSLGNVHPARVVDHSRGRLLCWVLEGTSIRVTTSPDGYAPRELPLRERFAGPRVPALSTWHGRSTLRLLFEREWYSVWWFFADDGTFRNWYVNLEIPLGRDATGIDRADGVLDVVVFPDLTWQWKDEDEVDAAIEAGRFDRGQIRLLRRAGEEAIALAEAGRFPFDGSHCGARPDPDWPLPELPPELVATTSGAATSAVSVSGKLG
ncbi:hypothetical protein FHX42_002947 [Saccharopolyspora lacisalsi]|uniref:DUF402 domain-containing protein n=1 Tax=Halosaccharopolyspora lacisalsi TaxID=1000566 RepID=A0A839E2E9_9PSEU|nr:DUF402 domain-containing protein [Halosaccharopolyspora lacisalsi]MBA8825581.1 hypothetical protein [Halosaccharopolyspora lacisalsi]